MKSLLLLMIINVQLMSKQDEIKIESNLPQFEDNWITKIVYDPNTIWYTSKEVPRVYQHADVQNNINAYLVSDNISADPVEFAKGEGNGGNGGVEFPWKNPGGTDNSNIKDYKFVYLPKPMIWYKEKLNLVIGLDSKGQPNRWIYPLGYGWLYPEGTVFGEVLTMNYQEKEVVFEVRLRVREIDRWRAFPVRPFRTLEELVSRINQLDQNNSIVDKLLQPQTKTLTVSDKNFVNHPTETAFYNKTGYFELPAIDSNLSYRLLTETKFKECEGWEFTENTFAPTSKVDSIVPKNYFGSLLGTDSKSCMNCHKHTRQHVNNFHFGRDWYGFIPGSDFIISFHPFSLDSLSTKRGKKPVKFREELLAKGVLEKYNPERHTKENGYNRIDSLRANAVVR